jgi:hypothetical protein
MPLRLAQPAGATMFGCLVVGRLPGAERLSFG